MAKTISWRYKAVNAESGLFAEQIEYERNEKAQKNASGQGQIKREVFSSYPDIARKSPKP